MNNIKKLRIEKGITQKTMSKTLGVSQSAISFWESLWHEIKKAIG